MKKKGAGFLIAKFFPNDGLRFLGLIAPIETRIKKQGIFDIPKGKAKIGESYLECAKRECKEESGIRVANKDIIGDGILDGKVMIYPAITTQEPVIMPNPESGIIEHDGYMWLTREEIVDGCLDYLRPCIYMCIKNFNKLKI
jgi:8-oxo-dGTP pyrophosphatase MutT (NUDIX family)